CDSIVLFRAFFFQAEDGIRDFHVTGVQTCALPIFPDNPDVPLILVGYETGISPYRAFMQQIKTEQRQHPCWMMLDVDAVSDEVIYQLDWLTARNSGCLLHIDPVACVGDDLTGFSGRLMEHRTRLIGWLLMRAH